MRPVWVLLLRRPSRPEMPSLRGRAVTAMERVWVGGHRSGKEVWQVCGLSRPVGILSSSLSCVHLVPFWNECLISSVPLCL